MLRLTRVVDPKSAPPAAGALRLRLTWGERVRSRLATMSDDGTAVAIVLPRGTVLRDGAMLAGEDGAVAVVEAAPQPLARITSDDPLLLLRAVYHLANRHVPAHIEAGMVLIERDPVLEAMASNLGARVEHIEQPFDPETGAYHGGGHTHGIEPDDPARSIGEELSIAAHRRRGEGQS